MASGTGGSWGHHPAQTAAPTPWVTIPQPLLWAIPPPSPRPGRVKEGETPGSPHFVPHSARHIIWASLLHPSFPRPPPRSWSWGKGPGVGARAGGFRRGPAELPSPRPAGTDAAAERADAPAASEWPGGRGAQPGACLVRPAGAWAGGGGVGVGYQGCPPAGPGAGIHLGFPPPGMEEWWQGERDPVSSPPPLLYNPQVYLEGQQEAAYEEEEETEAQEEGPLVFHHHYLPCLMPALGPLLSWPAPLLSPPLPQPCLQHLARVQHYPSTSGKRGT
ncbi:proline-rich protein 29 [Monodon monoceros]|uniref:proline-rich protein 29 n=1 Tax=Monodon monoceros TaxID=40151 RepID=UPI0010F97554|nr:proline-rich protein 29 [Monodon monoceros]